MITDTDTPGDDPEAPAPPAARVPTRTPPPKRPASSADKAIAAVLLGLLAIGFLVSAWPRITGPIGDSDEGINAAVWGFDSRALRELGPVESRFGGVRTDGTKYATHPPLIVAEAALIERVVGEHPWSTRAAAWLGTLVAIGLLFGILRELGLSPPVAAAATVATGASHMLFVYGAMLDTMITAFPFALAVAWIWYRQWIGRTTPRAPVILLLATLACLGGWQATFMVALCGLATLARVRHDRAAVGRALPYLVGAVIGVALTIAWGLWVYGSLSVLGDKLIRRTGGEDASIAKMIDFQLPWLGQLLGVGFLAWAACAVSLRDRRYRPLAALSLVSVIVYALVLKEGSGGHQYWNYWGLFPAAIGMGYAFGALARATRRRMRRRPLAATVAVLVAMVLVVAVNLSRPNQAADLIRAGYASYDLVASTPLAPGQGELTYVAEPNRIDDWIRYRGAPAVRPLLSADELRALARDHPEDTVLVLGTCARPDPTGICVQLTGSSSNDEAVPPRLVTAAELARQLDGGSSASGGSGGG